MRDEPVELELQFFERVLSIRDHSADESERAAGYQGLLDEIDQSILVAKATGNADSLADYREVREYVEGLIE
jgi:hypothetical protein